MEEIVDLRRGARVIQIKQPVTSDHGQERTHNRDSHCNDHGLSRFVEVNLLLPFELVQ
jgi:hypothetical protein